MQSTIQAFTQTIGFPAAATDCFCDLYGKVAADARAIEKLDRLKKRLLLGKVMNNARKLKEDLTPGLEWLAQQLGVHRYTVDMLLVVCAAPCMLERYQSLGFSEAFFYENAADITCKLKECRQVHGVWGTETLAWFYRFFTMDTLMFGRFQYERILFTQPTYTFGEYEVQNGKWVYNMHIPSTGPMPKEARLDSYKRIYSYVAPPDGILPIVCSSWLLWPDLLEICRPDSNMVGFIKDFDIIDKKVPPKTKPFPDAWRVFGMPYNGDTSVLPRDTDLQRRIADWLDKGNTIGDGVGILLFDGEKIINQKG